MFKTVGKYIDPLEYTNEMVTKADIQSSEIKENEFVMVEKKLLYRIDELLMNLEDTIKGEQGDEITKIRGKLSKLS
jgi:hypothetical protein